MTYVSMTYTHPTPVNADSGAKPAHSPMRIRVRHNYQSLTLLEHLRPRVNHQPCARAQESRRLRCVDLPMRLRMYDGEVLETFFDDTRGVVGLKHTRKPPDDALDEGLSD